MPRPAEVPPHTATLSFRSRGRDEVVGSLRDLAVDLAELKARAWPPGRGTCHVQALQAAPLAIVQLEGR